jgi:hypothetical protein
MLCETLGLPCSAESAAANLQLSGHGGLRRRPDRHRLSAIKEAIGHSEVAAKKI